MLENSDCAKLTEQCGVIITSIHSIILGSGPDLSDERHLWQMHLMASDLMERVTLLLEAVQRMED